jgi:gamma-glutamyltranspeptidase/glutathione hydrolase
VWIKGELHGINASGPSPKAISIEAVKERGFKEMPKHGLIPVTVPGAPSAWAALSKLLAGYRFWKCQSQQLNILKMIISHSKYWGHAYEVFKKKFIGDECKGWFDTIAPLGKAPVSGEMGSSKDHASTLRSMGETLQRVFTLAN